ncbi:MAG TPA: SxtJ family membrane protein [Gemmatimonadales bacterium]|nr:SxtJ family membrane protein [Gemmatimonadales bacterium]
MTAAEGRRFGLTLGAAFLALGGLLWWRGRAGAPVALVLGLLFLAAGVLAPGRLGPVRRMWLGLGEAISRVTTPIFLGIVYFGAILPIGLMLRARGRNPLTRHRSLPSGWVPRPVEARSRRDMERQF